MENKNFSFEYSVLSPKDLNDIDKTLVQHALNAATKAYAPYSNFRVGAAVLLDDDSIIEGNNQENAAYPSGLCAERVALFYANSNAPDKSVKSIAITVVNANGDIFEEIISPCGSCRQVIAETENRFNNNIRIILASKDKVLIFKSIKDLLPFHFKLK